MWLPQPELEKHKELLSCRYPEEEQVKRCHERFEPPPLPPDLRGKYRFGVTEEELKMVGAGPKLRELLSFSWATPNEIRRFRVQEAVHKYGKIPMNSGHSAVQIVSLTLRIRTISDSLKGTHKKDKKLKRTLLVLIGRRKRLLRYLKGQNIVTYMDVIKDLGLKDMVLPHLSRTWKH